MSFDTFESYERELAELASSAKEADTSDAIQNALAGNYSLLHSPGSVMVKGSSVLNAYTEACRLLRGEPSARLLEAKIALPEEPSTASKFLVSLLNGSVTRDSPVEPGFTSAGKSNGKSVCRESEDNFIIALGMGTERKFATKNHKTNRVFAGKDGNPIFFQKGYNIGTSLSLKPVALNGIGYPAGTLFSLNTFRSAAGNTVEDGLDAHTLEDISSLAPMRLSAFAFPRAEQEPTFTSDEVAKKHGIFWAGSLGQIGLNIDELAQHIPPSDQIAEALG